MNKGKRALAVLFVGWAAVGGVVIACSSDDAATTTTDAGTDAAKPVPTTTTTATTTATTPPPDATVPDDAAAQDDSGLDAGHGLWAFNNYCNGDASDDAGCNAFDSCPGFDGGGIAAQECGPPSTRCVAHAAADSGTFDRLFVCESTATPVWELNRICAYEGCADVDASACDGDGGGIAGETCSTPRTRCITNGDRRVFICQPNTGLVETFNGYCDAGPGIGACNAEAGACAPADGGTGGSPCTTAFERCLAPGSSSLDGGAKIFVCGDRSP